MFPHGVHKRRLSVSHQNKNVSVQTELIDPAVQLQSDISARATEQRSEVKGQRSRSRKCPTVRHTEAEIEAIMKVKNSKILTEAKIKV